MFELLKSFMKDVLNLWKSEKFHTNKRNERGEFEKYFEMTGTKTPRNHISGKFLNNIEVLNFEKQVFNMKMCNQYGHHGEIIVHMLANIDANPNFSLSFIEMIWDYHTRFMISVS